MSTDPTQLLRMLEPAVRPDGQGARVSGAARQGAEAAPFEQRAFDQLLSEFRQTHGPSETAKESLPDTAAETQPRPLVALGGIERIENASLRQQLEARHAATPTSDAATAPVAQPHH